jgi:phosphoribosylanthranilate isomerase
VIPHWILVGGLTSPQDARIAEALGADAISVVVDPADPRAVRLDMAAEIAASVTLETVLELREPSAEELRAATLTVEPTRLLLRGMPPADAPPPLPWFRVFQCSGRAVLSDLRDFPGDRFLLELEPDLLPGARGWQRDRTLLREVGRLGAMVVSGVPTLEPLLQVVEKARPWGVRLRSCVERQPGWMDHQALERAMVALRGRR